MAPILSQYSGLETQDAEHLTIFQELIDHRAVGVAIIDATSHSRCIPLINLHTNTASLLSNLEINNLVDVVDLFDFIEVTLDTSERTFSFLPYRRVGPNHISGLVDHSIAAVPNDPARIGTAALSLLHNRQLFEPTNNVPAAVVRPQVTTEHESFFLVGQTVVDLSGSAGTVISIDTEANNGLGRIEVAMDDGRLKIVSCVAHGLSSL